MRALRGVLFLVGLVAGAAAAGEPLRLCFEDAPQRPWTMPDRSGLSLDLLREVETRLGERFVFEVLPWRRCVDQVRRGRSDAAFGAADTPERRSFGVFPALADGRPDPRQALYDAHYYAYLRNGGPAAWDGRVLVPGGRPVVAPRGYIVARLLAERGFAVRESVGAAEDGLRHLAAGLADLAVLEGFEADLQLRTREDFRRAVTKAPQPYEILPFYLMFGRTTYDRDPARVRAIWAAIRTVRESPGYQERVAAATR